MCNNTCADANERNNRSNSTLTIEEWKAEQQLGERKREHSSSCQIRGLCLTQVRGSTQSANSPVHPSDVRVAWIARTHMVHFHTPAARSVVVIDNMDGEFDPGS